MACFWEFIQLLLLSLINCSLDANFCEEFPKNSVTYLGRVFNNKFIDSNEMTRVTLSSLFLCDRLCLVTPRCLALDFDNEKQICQLFDLPNINSLIKAKEISYVIIKLPIECKVENKVDGIWGSWQNDTKCTKSCGNGTVVQKRQCIEPSCNGQPCLGSNTTASNCNTRPCNLLLQKRFDGSVSFQREWKEYKNGFGNNSGEFWLGLEEAHAFMSGQNITLRFDMWDGDDHAFMEYYEATIESETDNYKFNYTKTSGTAGDSMKRSKGMMFTTKDRDNDLHSRNCAVGFGGNGGWWFEFCKNANLNGKYNSNNTQGIIWFSFRGKAHSLSKTEIRLILNQLR